MRSLFCALLAGLLISMVSCQLTYYMTSSSYIKAGKPYDLDVNIHRPLPEPLVVDIVLKQNNSYTMDVTHRYYQPDTIVLQKQVIINSQGSNKVQLMVPESLFKSEYRWYLMTSLEVNCSGAFAAFHSASLEVEDSSYSLYVQSDKAMYKPGDLVRFRTFATDSDLKPYEGKFNVSIQDPDKNILKVWRNVHADSGVVSAEFQLSDQPPLGNWIIKVVTEMGIERDYSFKVKEYVLPKFKVSVELPSFVLPMQHNFNGIVEAKYTFGKPVKGNASIAIGMRADGYRCREPWQENRYSHRSVDICRRYKIMTELDKDGKYDITIPMKEMANLLPYTVCNYRGEECDRVEEDLRYQTFFVWVNVTESATGVVLSGEANIRFSNDAVRLQFPQATPRNYKPGLPFIGYVQLNQPDGTPVPEADLMRYNGTKRMVNLTITRKCPYVRRPYPRPPGPIGPVGPPQPIARPLQAETTESPEDQTVTGMTSTTVTMGTTAEPPCVETTETQMLDVSPAGVMAFEVPVVSSEYESLSLQAHFTDKYGRTVQSNNYITPFETKSSKGLRILTEMEDGALQPGSTAEFEVTGSEEIKRLRIDIIAKGSVVYSADKVYDTPAIMQKFSLDITEYFARILAPTPRIVAWYVRDDGEMIADSVSFSVDSELANQVKVQFSTNETKPGENMMVTVEAYKGSTVGLLVVDQSVKLLATGNDITKEMVESSLRGFNPNTPYYPGLFSRYRFRGMCCGCWPYQMSGSDTTELFRNSGYLIFTDALVYQKPIPTYALFPRGERGEDGIMFESALAGRAGPAGPVGRAGPAPAPQPSSTANDGGLQSVDRVRTEFPETWIWLDTVVG